MAGTPKWTFGRLFLFIFEVTFRFDGSFSEINPPRYGIFSWLCNGELVGKRTSSMDPISHGMMKMKNGKRRMMGLFFKDRFHINSRRWMGWNACYLSFINFQSSYLAFFWFRFWNDWLPDLISTSLIWKVLGNLFFGFSFGGAVRQCLSKWSRKKEGKN